MFREKRVNMVYYGVMRWERGMMGRWGGGGMRWCGSEVVRQWGGAALRRCGSVVYVLSALLTIRSLQITLSDDSS